MDPLSITAGVLGLLGTCIKTGTALKDFYDGATIADTKVKGQRGKVEAFSEQLTGIDMLLRDKETVASARKMSCPSKAFFVVYTSE